jgi:molecular chaperone HtpG
VRVTTRPIDLPAYIVVAEGDMSGHLAQLLKQAGLSAPACKPLLEVNPEHALAKKLDPAEDNERFDDLAQVLFDQVRWAEGGPLEQSAAYVRRVNALLMGT